MKQEVFAEDREVARQAARFIAAEARAIGIELRALLAPEVHHGTFVGDLDAFLDASSRLT